MPSRKRRPHRRSRGRLRRGGVDGGSPTLCASTRISSSRRPPRRVVVLPLGRRAACQDTEARDQRRVCARPPPSPRARSSASRWTATTHIGVFDEGKVEVSTTRAARPSCLSPTRRPPSEGARLPSTQPSSSAFIAHRALMRGQGRRLAAIKAKWKALPPGQRQEIRKKVMERMRENRKKFREVGSAMKDKIVERKKEIVERRQRQQREGQRKMDERRGKINRRERRAGPPRKRSRSSRPPRTRRLCRASRSGASTGSRTRRPRSIGRPGQFPFTRGLKVAALE